MGNDYGIDVGELRRRFEAGAAWGLETAIDLRRCDPERIGDGENIRLYAKELCDLIQMKRFGPCIAVRFGEDERVAGYSMVQLIETSLVSGHFSELDSSAYINIFSCKWYNPVDAATFTSGWFRGDTAAMKLACNLRGVAEGAPRV